MSVLLDVATHQAEVRHIEEVGARFRLVSLTAEGFRNASWTPGDIVQIIVSGVALLGTWEIRSYTPLAFDPGTGTADILWYVHGNGPGSGWGDSAEVGTPCRLLGPRRALSLRKPQRPLVFFGDETSFSTAVALRETSSGHRDVRFVFEVDSVEGARTVVERFGIGDSAELIPREEDDRHLDEVEREVLDAYRSTAAANGVLTGKASSIQRLYRALRVAGVPGRQVTNVPYWAPGKKGLKGH
ncbi:siderophore-interacting protein [Amycolatopsis mongoliensis]|uniref:Siderophore-interacting protein n=1 Tax=Amycolatopsis mongoliensis TaxID=715475 RepID=A0A9Y2JIY2_9PSEU|nr:siderophore-interacting protein [Amycolatopsis sp. 4-36]WIX98236.1 siderophore-interacting protein [Amycolatopsis sp. 4-36]